MAEAKIREAKLETVALTETRPAPAYVSQRAVRDHWVDHLVSNFDLEEMGNPTVSYRDGVYFVLDGNHRIEALKRLGFGDYEFEMWVYRDLTPQQESERFLKLNDSLTVDALTKFMVSVSAGRPEEVAIAAIVDEVGLRVGVDAKAPNTLAAVGGLARAYREGGPDGLRRTLTIIRDAFGDGGYESSIISGLGQVISHYGADFDDAHALAQLSKLTRGSKGLLQLAAEIRQDTGRQKYMCVGAAIVEVYNKGFHGRSSARLGPWFKRASRP